MELGKRLKELRKGKNLTQQKLADILELSKGAIFQYETNKRRPNFEVMAKLEKYFNVSAAYLLGETDVNNYQDITVKIDTECTEKEFDEALEKLAQIYKNLNVSNKEVIKSVAASLLETQKNISNNFPDKQKKS